VYTLKMMWSQLLAEHVKQHVSLQASTRPPRAPSYHPLRRRLSTAAPPTAARHAPAARPLTDQRRVAPQVLGTDVSARQVERAGRGRFSADGMRTLPPGWQAAFFSPAAGTPREDLLWGGAGAPPAAPGGEEESGGAEGGGAVPPKIGQAVAASRAAPDKVRPAGHPWTACRRSSGSSGVWRWRVKSLGGVQSHPSPRRGVRAEEPLGAPPARGAAPLGRAGRGARRCGHCFLRPRGVRGRSERRWRGAQARARFRAHGPGVVVEVKDGGARCRVLQPPPNFSLPSPRLAASRGVFVFAAAASEGAFSFFFRSHGSLSRQSFMMFTIVSSVTDITELSCLLWRPQVVHDDGESAHYATGAAGADGARVQVSAGTTSLPPPMPATPRSLATVFGGRASSLSLNCFTFSPLSHACSTPSRAGARGRRVGRVRRATQGRFLRRGRRARWRAARRAA